MQNNIPLWLTKYNQTHFSPTFQMLKFSLQLFPQLNLLHKLLLQFLCKAKSQNVSLNYCHPLQGKVIIHPKTLRHAPSDTYSTSE